MKKLWQGATLVVKILIAVVAVAAFIGLFFLVKNFNIGGWLHRLFKGEPQGKEKVKIANSVPQDRVDKTGHLIPHGEPDDQGFTQWSVHAIETSSNPFRDKSKLKVVRTVEEKQGDAVVMTTQRKEIVLPTGVKDTDVTKVVEVRPEVFVVEVRDTSRVRATDLLNQLP